MDASVATLYTLVKTFNRKAPAGTDSNVGHCSRCRNNMSTTEYLCYNWEAFCEFLFLFPTPHSTILFFLRNLIQTFRASDYPHIFDFVVKCIYFSLTFGNFLIFQTFVCTGAHARPWPQLQQAQQ